MEALAPDRRVADRYVIEELIATGGMATVWRATDEVLARTVALKCLRDDLAGDSDFLERFRREAVSAARMTHPNIVSVYDTGVDGDVCYIVMEHLDGRPLSRIMEEEAPLQPDRAVQLILPVLNALEFAHEQGTIHRDLKPANILVGSDGRVKVTDFGIAKAAFTGRDLTTTGAVLGTVRYISPEQVQGAPIDTRSDLYSVGLVLYELLTGRPAFEAPGEVATAMMRLTTDPIPPRDLRPEIPRDVEAAVLKAMARSPEDRFRTAGGMRAALERHAAAGPPTPARGMPTVAVPRVGPAVEGGTDRTSVSDRPEVGWPDEGLVGLEEVSREAGGRRSVFRSWILVPLLVVLVAGAMVAVGIALSNRILDSDGSSGSTPGGAQAIAKIDGVRDVDPEGDGSEHPGEVRLAMDGDGGTAWRTDRYNSAAFGGLKSGLGLWIDLAGTASVDRVTVTGPIRGWSFQLQAGSSPESARRSKPVVDAAGKDTFTIGRSGRAVVSFQPVQAGGLLIWVTELGPDEGRFGAAVAEVRVEGERG